jgi:hypothetical protein
MTINKTLTAAFIAATLTLCSSAAELKLGKPLTLKKQTPIATLAAAPAPLVNKTVQVKGKVTEVCQMMGCWMMLTDSEGNKIRIKVKDGEITFPKDAAGKTAIAEGKLVKIELTAEKAVEQAKHEAQENGRTFDPASVKGPQTIYQIQGTGAVLLD